MDEKAVKGLIDAAILAERERIRKELREVVAKISVSSKDSVRFTDLWYYVDDIERAFR